ncbi:hypothetical protein MGU_11388 [Metarhizium guizhouense ARSEF 977]|uniref:Uncharacterized protein n=1 Tax=Metarhizium guizhouense (strain ARSEF 977) TaxID=1276136 RepID=A0A0B4GUQ9_METGA|nr:hypothetical protein MGU_11388 [Metarhizium guizhouense ARSEF 977]
MASTPTYFLAPNFEHKLSSSPIQLGVLLADPLKPTKPLSTPSSPPEFDSIVQTSYAISRTSDNAVNTGVHATFLSFAGASVNSANNFNVIQSFDINTLETRRLKSEPQDDDEDLLACLQEPKVQAAIRGGLYGARPIYMISGLKIARGLSVQREESKSTRGSVGGTVPIVEGISAGAEIGGEKRFGTSTTFKMAPEEDIIFAYQVHKIKPTSRKVTSASVNVHEASAAFLHGNDEHSGFKGLEVVSVSADSVISEDEYDSEGEDEQHLELKGSDGEYYIHMGQA